MQELQQVRNVTTYSLVAGPGAVNTRFLCFEIRSIWSRQIKSIMDTAVFKEEPDSTKIICTINRYQNSSNSHTNKTTSWERPDTIAPVILLRKQSFEDLGHHHIRPTSIQQNIHNSPPQKNRREKRLTTRQICTFLV